MKINLHSFTLYIVMVLFFLSCQNSGKEKSASTEMDNKPEREESFSYYPAAPVNGINKGVIILGSSGFDAFVINIDKDKNWKLVKSEYGVSNVYEGNVTLESVKEGLKTYIAEMLVFDVEDSKIYFVVSSSARENNKVKEIMKILREIGYVIKEVTEEEEATFAYQALMPEPFRNESFTVDIGSGNTKVTWMSPSGELTSFVTYGSKYYQDQTSDSVVYNEITQLAKQIPNELRKKCFLIGGAAYNLANMSEQFSDKYTVLKSPDSYSTDDPKTKAGLVIYSALKAETQAPHFIFDWSTNFSIGYIVSLPL